MKYYCLINNADKEIAQLDDTRADGTQKITISCSAIYNSKIDAQKMKKLLESYLKKTDLVTIKECEVKINEKD